MDEDDFDKVVDEDDLCKDRRLNLTISSELHKKLRIRAINDQKNMSRVVEDALNVYFFVKDSGDDLSDQ